MTEAKTVQTPFWAILVSALTLCLFAAAPLAAQDYGQEGQQQKQETEQQYQQPKSKDFSKKELKKFAQARTEVEKIRSEYSEKLKGVEDTNKARELQDKYSQKMVDAIKDTGMRVQKYNEISMAVQDNPELKKKIKKMGN